MTTAAFIDAGVERLVSHRFDLKDTPVAFALQDKEAAGLVKSLVYPNR